MRTIITTAIVRRIRAMTLHGDRVEEIAAAVRLSVSRVYELRRRLRECAGDVAAVVRAPRVPRGQRHRTAAERHCAACGMRRAHVEGRCVVCLARAAPRRSGGGGDGEITLRLGDRGPGETAEDAAARLTRYEEMRRVMAQKTGIDLDTAE